MATQDRRTIEKWAWCSRRVPEIRNQVDFYGILGLKTQVISFVSYFNIYLFVAVSGLSRSTRGPLQLWHTGSSAHRLCRLQHMASLVEAYRLSSPMGCAILLPWPGIDPASPALKGGFHGTSRKVPPGYFLNITYKMDISTFAMWRKYSLYEKNAQFFHSFIQHSCDQGW